jgi:seryl-tRNA synthetase
MLDIRFIRQNLDLVKEAVRKKGFKVDLERLVEVDEQRRKLIHESESLRAEQNRGSKELGRLKDDEKAAAATRLREMSERFKSLNEELRPVETEYNDLMMRVPNVPAAEVPEGTSDADNVEIRKWGEPRKFDFEPRDHVEVGQALDIIDVQRGVKLSGSRSYCLKGDGALLENAIMQFGFAHIIKKGFKPLSGPVLVKDFAMYGTAFFPFGEEQTYRVKEDQLNLVGTSEVFVTAYHSDEILKEEDLPLLYAALSTCFRREAGTYGRDTKGIYRVHQFQKVEQVVLCKADEEESRRQHEFILKNSEEVLQALQLPYRVVVCCSGDLGLGQVMKYDLEAWMPSRKAYGETHSASRYHDFQARRLNIRYKDKDGKTTFVHTLNNTVVASTRLIIAILENYQQADGSVIIPEILRPYMGGRDRIKAGG